MTDQYRTFRTAEESCDPQQQFVAMLPTIRRNAQTAANRPPFDRRDEFVQDVVAYAYELFTRLVDRKLRFLAYSTKLAAYAIALVRAGRVVGVRLNRHDILSPQAKRRHGPRVVSLESPPDRYGRTWRESVVDERNFSPADAAAFRLDFQAWLRRLPPQKRAVVTLLAQGETNSATAKHFQVSDGRISQIRRELENDWELFHEGPSSERRRQSDLRHDVPV
jgi:hypothetical protein